MIPRVVLALVAVVVLGWVSVLLRNYEIGREPALRSFFAADLDPRERKHDLATLGDVQLLDPSSYWELARANALLSAGRPAAAAEAAERLVQSEPENLFAWGLLAEATRASDPARSREAARAIRRLNPLGSR